MKKLFKKSADDVENLAKKSIDDATNAADDAVQKTNSTKESPKSTNCKDKGGSGSGDTPPQKTDTPPKESSFRDEMSPEERVRYEQYEQNLRKNAQEQSSPYDIRNKYDADGNIKSATTYDDLGNRAYQYEVNPNVRHGEGYHKYDNTGTNRGMGKGERTTHQQF